ncbi:MAG: hypothetical protein KGI51_06565 [Rhodospirillales bacterium]|nr:hypothetical protein [Rhodospirillales bacterium]
MEPADAIRAARRRHGLAESDPAHKLPAYRGRIGPLPAARRRAFMRHLAEEIADAFARPAHRPQETPLPAPEAARAGACCACCRGQCCAHGEEHAYLDADTIRRMRAAEPGLTRAAIVARYRAKLTGERYEGSCVFHGAAGCVLDRSMRGDLCNSFLCNDVKAALRHSGPALLVARDEEAIRRIAVYRPEPAAKG